MSDLLTPGSKLGNISELLNKAQERIQQNRRRAVSNRYFFGTNPSVDGQPRLTRIAVREQPTNAGELQFVLTSEITVDGFSTTSELHQLERYEEFIAHQVARVRTQQWVNEDNADEIHNLTDLMVKGYGWRLLNKPAKLNEERETEDLLVLTPTEAFDPENPSHYGLPIDFEISGERDPERKKRSFDGDFVAVADSTKERIEDFIRMEPPENATEEQLEEFEEMQLNRVEDLLQYLSAVTGRYQQEDQRMWAKNCTSGAFRLPTHLDEFPPGAKVIDSFYERAEDAAGQMVYQPIEDNFEEIRLYGNTPTTDDNDRVVSSALMEAVAKQKAHNAKLRAGEIDPDGNDPEFTENEGAFDAIAGELEQAQQAG